KNDFVVAIVEMSEGFQALAQSARRIIGANDDRHLWQIGHRIKRRIMPGLLESVCRGLFTAIGPRHAKTPIENLLASSEPIIGERKDNGTGQAMLEYGAHVRSEQLGLGTFTRAARIKTEFP